MFLTACAINARAAPTPSSQASAEKQLELNKLHTQLKQLKKELASNESQKSEAADALKDSERSISEANRVLSALSEERALTANELAALEKDIAQSRAGIRQSQEKLKALLLSRYKAGQIEAWRLILSQQDPNRVSRELTYYRYLSQAQLDLAHTLEKQLIELNRLADEIRQKNEELRRIASEKQRLKQSLLADQEEKARLLKQLSNDIKQQRNQIQKLASDEKRISTLVEKLDALAKRQQAERAKKLAQQQREAKQSNSPSKTDTRINQQLPDASFSGEAFANLKGKLRLPLKGEVIGKFGASRGEGADWKGIFIRSPSGESVKAVANGEVVFADWLRGFGNLIILDHGNGYLSIYAANESLLKQVGDTIKAGDNIATSGNSGGMGDSGVYFELRQNGKPLDPLTWVKG